MAIHPASPAYDSLTPAVVFFFKTSAARSASSRLDNQEQALRLTIIKKSFLAFAIVLMPMLALFAYGYMGLRNYLETNTLRDLSIISGTVETQVEQYVNLTLTQTRNFASDGLIKAGLEELAGGNTDAAAAVNAHLEKNKLPLNPYLIRIDLITPGGRVAASSAPGRRKADVAQEPFFLNALKGATITPEYSGENAPGVMTVTVPVTGMKGRKTIGYLSTALTLEELDHIINGEFSPEFSEKGWWGAMAPTLEIYLVNNDKKMLTRSRFVPDAILKQTVNTLPVRMCAVEGAELRAFYPDYRGVEVAGASECLKTLGWTLLVEQDKDMAFAFIGTLRKYALITAALVTALFSLIFTLFYRSIALRLTGLSAAAAGITTGDYTVKLPTGAQDEIGELANAFKTMAGGIRERAESLSLSEEKYRSLVTSIPDCVWTTDEDGNTVFISPNVEDIIGYTQTDFSEPGNKELWFSNVHADDIKTVADAFGRLFTIGEPFDVEYRYRHRDGRWLWLHDRALSTHIKDGKKLANGVFTDITAKKQAEADLRESEERLKQAQRIAKVGSWDWDIVKNRLVWSEEIYRIFGIAPNEFGATYDAFLNSVHPDDRPLVKAAVNNALHEHTVYSIDHRIVLPGRSGRVVHEEASVTYDQSDRPVRMCGTVQDITERVEAEEAVKSIARFPSENPNPVLRAANDGTMLYANTAFQRHFGEYIAGLGMMLPETWQLICKEVRKSGLARETEVAHKDAYFSFVFAPVAGADYVNIYGSNITVRKRAEFELKKLSMAMEQSVNIVFITDEKGIIEYVNPRFETVTGYSKTEAVGQTPRILSSGDVTDAQYEEMWKTILAGRTWRSVYRNRKKTGGYYWCNSVISPIINDAGETTHFLAVQEDVTEKMRSDERVKRLAEHDELTGLVNRARFMEIVSRWIEETKASGCATAALILLDLDYFKFMNETYGHGAADEHLRRLAGLYKGILERLHAEMPDKDGREPVLGRLGGDEMAVFLPWADETGAMSAAERLRTATESLRHSDVPVSLTVSAGVVIYPKHGTDLSSLFTGVDAARYRAKELGRNRCHLYRPEDRDLEEIHSRFSWKGRIESAIREDRFVPYYQPILDLRDDRIHHYESLARMLDESGALLLPGSFIDVAERFGLIRALDRVIIEKTMRKQAQTLKAGVDVSFSINLSGKDITDESLLAFLQTKLEETGASPMHIIFEITETAAISDIEGAKHFVAPLRSLGCRFALDDFGVGFTSFTYLRELQADYIKIDGSFIRNVDKSPKDRVFVKAISEMAAGLGIKTIAEFVERKEVAALLKAFGVDYAQGYLIGKPQPLLLPEHEKGGDK
ncbi:MAG: EAL domain-containing protein [Deltaproteobacteria bacterium]|nr:EAL domain-containing protein [Deltaproteobacteria bacterium]